MLLQLYRSAYRGLSHSIWLLAIVMFINRSGAMVIPFLGVYLTQALHFSIDQAGIIMALFGVGSIAGTMLGGRLIDRIGSYSVMWISLMLGGLMYLVVGQLRTFSQLCIGTFTLGMMAEAFRPAVTAAVALYSTAENRTRSYSLNRLAINLGWSLGPAIGGWLASRDYSLLFWVDGLTCLGASLVLRLTLPKPKSPETASQRVKTAGDSAYHDHTYLVFILFVTFFAITFFQLFSTVPVYYKEVYHLSENQIGNLMALNGVIIVVVEMVLVHQLENRVPGLLLMAVGTFLVAVSYFIFNVFFGIQWLIISMVVATFAEMLAMPFMNTFAIQRSQPHNRGQYTALYTVAWSIAQISAPLIGTQFISRFSFASAWWLMIAFSLFATTGLLLLFRFLKKKESFSGN